MAGFDCDKNLPERGIANETKRLLLEKLDESGGLVKLSRQSKLLEKICNDSPDQFGYPGSELRNRVQTTVDHWKRHKDFASVRSKIVKKGATNQPPKVKSTTKRTPPRAATKRAEQPPPTSPPSVKRVKKRIMSATSFGSPGSRLGRSSRKSKKEKLDKQEKESK